MAKTIFLILAAVAFGLSAFNVNLANIGLVSLGFMFVTIALILKENNK
jgi:hypothetical protein